MADPRASDFSMIGGRTPRLLVTLGSDPDPRARKLDTGYRIGGNSDIYKLLPDGFAFDQLNLSKQFLNQPNRPDPARYECVLNLVTDPDQHPQRSEPTCP